MKRIVLHIFALLLIVAGNAQILTPMGSGLPASPDKIAAYNDNVVVAYSTRDNDIELQVWNGDFWYILPSPQLPKAESTSFGKFQILDLLSFEGKVYLAAGYKQKLDDQAVNIITRWNGEMWEAFTNPSIFQSVSIDKLFVQDNTLKCVGKFSQGNIKFNILKLLGNDWLPEGNSITNANQDKFNTFTVANNQLIATGKFTNPVSNNTTLAVWDGTSWQAASYPPFLGQNISLGTYSSSLVMFGNSPTESETVKRNINGVWQNMSQGLENYTVENINHFAEIDNRLFAVGDFVNKTTKEHTNLMQFDGSQWQKTSMNLPDIEQLHSFGNSVLVSGKFDDNARLSGIGKIYIDKAQIVSRVFNDINGDCKKDVDEDWMPNYPLALQGVNANLYTDLNGYLYLPVKLAKHEINAAAYNHYLPTCPAASIDANEYKTYFGVALGVKQKTNTYDGQVFLADNQSYTAENGETKKAVITIKNLGSLPIINAQLVLNHTTGIRSFTSDKTYDSYANGVATYTLTVGANEVASFEVGYEIADETNASIDGTLLLKSGQTDVNTQNNYAKIHYNVGHTETNFKNCGNGKQILPNTDMLQYKIGFKNLNNKTAYGVKIVDEFDTDVSIQYNKGMATLSSHANYRTFSEPLMNANGEYYYKVTTEISNITLPTAQENDKGSEGFVEYHVYLKDNSLKQGMEICNTAKIYFSFSPGTYDEAIVTNTVCSNVADELGIINGDGLPLSVEDLAIGPNPVSDRLHIANSGSKSYDISLINTLGQHMGAIKVKAHQQLYMDVKDLPSGVYTVYVDGAFAKKIILTK
jgi:hypothetical protein